jgi:hypothetical protein
MNESQVILNMLDGLVAIISTGTYPREIVAFINSISCYFKMYLNSGTNYSERRLYLSIITSAISQKISMFSPYPRLQAYLIKINTFVTTNYPTEPIKSF